MASCHLWFLYCMMLHRMNCHISWIGITPYRYRPIINKMTVHMKIVDITHLASEAGQYHSDENGRVGKYVEKQVL